MVWTDPYNTNPSFFHFFSRSQTGEQIFFFFCYGNHLWESSAHDHIKTKTISERQRQQERGLFADIECIGENGQHATTSNQTSHITQMDKGSCRQTLIPSSIPNYFFFASIILISPNFVFIYPDFNVNRFAEYSTQTLTSNKRCMYITVTAIFSSVFVFYFPVFPFFLPHNLCKATKDEPMCFMLSHDLFFCFKREQLRLRWSQQAWQADSACVCRKICVRACLSVVVWFKFSRKHSQLIDLCPACVCKCVCWAVNTVIRLIKPRTDHCWINALWADWGEYFGIIWWLLWKRIITCVLMYCQGMLLKVSNQMSINKHMHIYINTLQRDSFFYNSEVWEAEIYILFSLSGLYGIYCSLVRSPSPLNDY